MTRDEAEKISHELVQKGMAEADAYIAAARTMLAALKEIATHWANNYDHPEMYRGPYGVGVVDGHRACTIIARAAIAQAEAAGIEEG